MNDRGLSGEEALLLQRRKFSARLSVEAAKRNLCEPLLVHGSTKQICVKDANNPVPKSDQTKQQIQGILEANMRHLAPLVP